MNLSMIFVGLHITVAAGLFISVYWTFAYMRHNRILHQGVETVYARLNTITGTREQIDRQLREMYGSVGKHDWLNRISDNLKYSGLERRFPALTPELFLVLLILAEGAAFLTGFGMSGRWYMGAAASAVLYLAFEYTFDRLRDKRYKQVESQLLALINSVDNYAEETDDIIHILERVSDMMEEPLRSELYAAVTAARNEGASKALRELEYRVEHPFFKTFVRNLEISSRNSANYKDIVEGCRGMLSEQLANSKKLENIYHNARLHLGAIIVCSIVCLYIMAEFLLGISLWELAEMLAGSIPGIILLAGTAGTLMVSGYYALVKGKRRE